MYLTSYIKSLIVSLTILILTTLVSVNSQAETCTTNDLGDRTCTTTTAGTTTGNVLTNSTIGTSGYSTSGWTISGDIGHGHSSTNGTTYTGQNTTGGNIAFEGDPNGKLYQDVDLVGDGKLTQAQINEGFTSTMSADIWFWNMFENTTTLKQTITASDGTVTTQVRNINDHDPNRPYNGGQWTNYTDSYTHGSNTQTDFTIRAEIYNDTAGTSYDGNHYGPDVDNVELSITTAGVQSTTFTPCQELGTCTDAGNDIADAVDLKTDDGVDLFQDLDTKVEDAIKDFEEVEVVTIDTTMFIEDDLGEIEEVKFEDFIEDSFTSFLEENNLVEEFKTELEVEGITEDEFFEELGNEMMEEIGGDMMTEIISLDEEMIEEPKMDEMIEEPNMEEFKDEEMIEEPNMEEMKEEEIANEPKVEEESPQEEVKEEVKQEEVKEESTETESNANTETTTKTEDTSEESMETNEEGEPTNEESTMDENTEAEGSETETNNEEAVDDEATSNDEQDADKIDSVNVKVKRIIAKLEKTLKNVDDKVKAVQFVTLKGIQAQGANLSSYANVKLEDTIKLNDGNPDFFNQLNIQQEQIYTNKSLNAYTNNDPISIKQTELQRIDIEKKQLLLELKILREG